MHIVMTKAPVGHDFTIRPKTGLERGINELPFKKRKTKVFSVDDVFIQMMIDSADDSDQGGPQIWSMAFEHIEALFKSDSNLPSLTD